MHRSITDSRYVRERLAASRSPVALTGAGISAESGVPVFRGDGGLWRSFRPEELATPQAFKKDPALVWEWYDWRRAKLASAEPNKAHYALAELEKRFLEGTGKAPKQGGASQGRRGFTLVTQNVDGLHFKSGSRNVIELHGSIWRVRCLKCNAVSRNTDVPIKILPRCGCGGVLRPDVVWFGEVLAEDITGRAFDAAGQADFMMVIGTSGVVQPAASLAVRAKEAGAFLVEINTETTPLSGIMDAKLSGKAGDIVPGLL